MFIAKTSSHWMSAVLHWLYRDSHILQLQVISMLSIVVCFRWQNKLSGCKVNKDHLGKASKEKKSVNIFPLSFFFSSSLNCRSGCTAAPCTHLQSHQYTVMESPSNSPPVINGLVHSVGEGSSSPLILYRD